MALTSKAAAKWEGNLTAGAGTISLVSSGLSTYPYNFKARKDGEAGVTTPEELLGAAHSACFSMALSMLLGNEGFTPTSVDTTAAVTFDVTPSGPAITGITLTNTSVVPGITAEKFAEIAEATKAGCPVSKALAGVPITLQATLNN